MKYNTDNAEITVIVVNWNTRDLTISALETLYANAGDLAINVVVWDNASDDGSADAIAEQFPQVSLVRCAENIGFALANNRAIEQVETEWVLLLNSDTETHPGAVANLLQFAKANPQAGIVGGQTVFPDGSLNPTSCWNQMTIWSLFCSATGLTRAFRSSRLFNPEGIGGWKRDDVRQVDIVTGCFFLLKTATWRELGGFQDKYFMYGEEVDMCLRAAKLGYRPMITPKARIMHLGGASARKREEKMFQQASCRATLIQDHWGPIRAPLGLLMLRLWITVRASVATLQSLFGRGDELENSSWRNLWSRRREWLRGYPDAV
ncbi:MAG: glycosyltransferase family 2 protein [Pseudomonadota bacterium]